MKQKPLKINTPLIYSRNLLLAPISAWIPPDSDLRLLLRGRSGLVVAKKLDRPSAEFFYVYTSSKEEQVSTVVEYDALDDVFDPFDEYFNRCYFYN
jgi:hypothetical protein